MDLEGQIVPPGFRYVASDRFGQFAARLVRIEGGDYRRAGDHFGNRRLNQTRLFRIGPAADAAIARPVVLIREQRRMGKSVNGAFGEHQPLIFRMHAAHPQALFTAGGKAGIVPVLDFVSAQPS